MSQVEGKLTAAEQRAKAARTGQFGAMANSPPGWKRRAFMPRSRRQPGSRREHAIVAGTDRVAGGPHHSRALAVERLEVEDDHAAGPSRCAKLTPRRRVRSRCSASAARVERHERDRRQRQSQTR